MQWTISSRFTSIFNMASLEIQRLIVVSSDTKHGASQVDEDIVLTLRESRKQFVGERYRK